MRKRGNMKLSKDKFEDDECATDSARAYYTAQAGSAIRRKR